MAKIDIKDLWGGLNLQEPSTLNDNQFEILSNFNYDADGRLITRRGVANFGNPVPSNKPQTSYFFYKNSRTNERTALISSWTAIYKYTESTQDWSSIKTWLTEFEADGTTRTRWSFAVLLEKIYMCNWVDCYAEYDPATDTYTELWVSSVWACTFTNATDLVNLATHWLSDWNSVKFTSSWTLPAEITSGRYYYVVNANTNDFQISLTPNGTPIDFTDDGTWTHTCFKTIQPRVRYLSFLADSIYGSWYDQTPHTLYVTTATDWTDLTASDIYIGWETDGRINGQEELQESVLVYKDKKVFNVAWDLSEAKPLDAENGGYWERAIRRVWNSLVYFNDRWFNTLKAKSGITGTSAIQDEPLSDDVRALTALVTPKEYNATIWTYLLPLTNYYGSFETQWWWTPDTTLVYSTLQKAWSRHLYPAHYDFGTYEDDDGLIHYIMTSATSNQVFEMETGFQDLSSPINTELLTKRFDLWEALLNKTHTAVDIQGLKSEWGNIEVDILVDWEEVWGWTITDDYITSTSSVLTIWTSPIWSYTVWGWEVSTNEIDLYKYFIRFPLYEVWSNIQIKITSEDIWLVYTLDKLTLHLDKEDVDLFSYDNIG